MNSIKTAGTWGLTKKQVRWVKGGKVDKKISGRGKC